MSTGTKNLTVKWLGDASDVAKAADQVSGSAAKTETAVAGVGTKAQAAFKGVSGMLQASALELGPFGTALDTIGSSIEKLGQKGQGLSAAMGIAGAGVTALGTIGLTAASGLEKSEAQLKAAADAAGISQKQLDDSTKGLAGHMENLGNSNQQTNEALRAFVQAGRPAAELNKDMALAADLAAAKHESLSTAATDVAKVYGGNTKILKQYGIDTKSLTDSTAELTKAEAGDQKMQDELAKVTEQNRLAHMAYDAQKTHSAVATEQLRLSDQKLAETQQTAKASAEQLAQAQAAAADGHTKAGEAVDLLSQKLKGQGEAAVDSFGGKLDVMKTKLLDLAGHVGEKVGPALATMGPIMMGVSGIMGTGLLPAIGSVVVAFGPLILAIGAVIAIGVLLWKNWDSIASGLSTAWHAIADAASAVWNGILDFFTGWWNTVKAVFSAGWDFVTGLFSKALDGIKTGVSDAWDFVTGIFTKAWSAIETGFTAAAQWISDKISEVVSFYASLPGRVWDAAVTLIDDLWNLGTTAMTKLLDGITGAAEAIWSFYSSLPGRVLDALGDLGSVLWQAGKDLIGGLVKGIEDGAGDVMSAIGSIAQKAMHAITHPWEVFSPSKVTQRLGANIMAGLAGGIAGGKSGVLGAIGDVTAAATDRFGGVQTTIAAAAGPGGGASIGAGLGAVYITLDVHDNLVGSEQQLGQTIYTALLQLERTNGPLFLARTP